MAEALLDPASLTFTEVRSLEQLLVRRLWRTRRTWLFWLLACAGASAHLRAQTTQPAATSARPNASSRPNANTAYLPRLEVGVNIADIRTDCITSLGQKYCGLPSFGIGLAAAYNLTSHFAIDAHFVETPSGSTVSTNLYGGRHTEYMAGLRSEVRAQHYGFFVKTQIGTLSWNHVITGVVKPPNAPFYLLFGEQRKFAANAAAGVEYSPSPEIHIRGEIGDLIRQSPSAWQNNLQSMVGVYVGIGKPLTWRPPVYNAKATHRFFDTANLSLMTASVLGMTADAITTQRFISRGAVEGDPFAKPLVKYGWSGQIASEGIEINALVWGMYGLHRIHQHWIERIAPAGVAVAHALFAYSNDKSNP